MPDVTHIADALSRADVAPETLESADGLGAVVRVASVDAAAALRALRESSHAYDYPVDVFGVDTGEGVDIVYHLRSLSHGEEIFVKIAYPYGGELTSVWELFPAALMPEREAAEMLGLTLSGHPNPKHLLLTSGIEPLLLKRVAIRTAEEVRNR